MAGTSDKVDRQPMTWVWMVLAIVVVAGFLTWLGMASEPSEVTVVVEEDDEELGLEPDEEGVIAVPRDSLAENKGVYEGQTIRVDNVQAAGILGPGIFWGELGDASRQVPLLVRMDSTLVERGLRVAQGDRYRVTGTLHRMTDELAETWGEQGEFNDEGGQLQAAFTDYYLQARNIRPARAGGGEREQGQRQEGSGAGSTR